MPRKLLRRSVEFPYHVTTRSNNRDWFKLSKERYWSIFEEKLAIVSERCGAQVISFVLMSNHIHMIIVTPRDNLDSIMNYLVREVSRKMSSETGRINRIFGGRYKWSLIEDTIYFGHAYKYVYRNPIEPGLVERVEEYPFSTLYYLNKNWELKFPIYDRKVIDWGVKANWSDRLL